MTTAGKISMMIINLRKQTMEIHWIISTDTSLKMVLQINKINNFLANWSEDNQVKTIRIKGYYLLLRKYKIIRIENYGTIIIMKEWN